MKRCGIRVTVDGDVPRQLGLTRTEIKVAAEYFAARSAARSGLVFRDVTIILQDDAASADVHLAINGVSGATDVVTQAYDALPGEDAGVYGELYVNCDQAFRFPKTCRGWSPAKELLLYVAHGMDHLSGADDLKPREYDTMRHRELGWLRDFFR